jgi:hypothetical protein
MRPEAWARMEYDHLRTESLFRRGRTWMALLIGGSAVAAALALRIAVGA